MLSPSTGWTPGLPTGQRISQEGRERENPACDRFHRLQCSPLSHITPFRDPEDCSPPSSSVRGILQARVLERVAISSSRGSSPPRDGTWVSFAAGGFFRSRPPGKPPGSIKSRRRKPPPQVVLSRSVTSCLRRLPLSSLPADPLCPPALRFPTLSDHGRRGLEL